MIAPERFEKLESSRALRQYLATKKVENAALKDSRKNFWARLIRPLPSLTTLQTAAAVLLVLGASFAVWRVFFYQSAAEKNLAVLKQAYRSKRTVEARIVEFEYIPLTRGISDKDAAGTLERDRAERLLLDAAAENKNAANLYALGKVYLAERNFDKAVPLFEEAAKLAPNDAKLFSDFGAAMLEAGKKASNDNEGAKSLESLARSLEYLEKAVALDPQLLEPRFNRALALETMFLPEQAKEAWKDYLQRDQNSPWVTEAREHLQNLESRKVISRSADELERDFLQAFRQQNEEEAWHLLSSSRELFREKYLPQKLAASFLEASENERDEFLQAMIYAGAIEKKRIGDFFAAELAQFYAQQPPSKLETLGKAQHHAVNGYRLVATAQNFQQSLKEFETAKTLFAEAGNVWEVKLVEYALGNCLYNSDRISRSIDVLWKVSEFCRSRNFKWLQWNSSYWYIGGLLELKKLTEALRLAKDATALAQEIQSPFLLQQHFAAIALQYSFIGQNDESLNYLQKTLKESFASETSLPQKFRNFESANTILSRLKFHRAAQAFALENVRLADQTGNPTFITRARVVIGRIYSEAEEFAEARKWFADCLEKARTLEGTHFRENQEMTASMNLAHIERQVGDFEKAVKLYNQVLFYYESAGMPFELYEAQKGRLQAYLALENNAELETQIPATLDLAEKFRKEIFEEQERSSFFDREQNIYDIAVDFEFRRGRYERAFDYTEKSNSRSLLDWLQRGAEITSGDNKNFEILFKESAETLSLQSIREQIPARAQILQYSVLPDKTLIWLITKEKFTVVETPIGSDALRRKVEIFLKLMLENDNAAKSEIESLQRELFDLLILPVSSQLDSSLDLCIVPHKILFHLPFAALLSATGGKTLLEDFNLSYAPSANVFIVCTKNAERKKSRDASETLLSVGNPTFDRKDFEDLMDLPAAESEAREIAALYDKKQILVGREATKAAFLDGSKAAEIIHFAGHYAVIPGAPLSSRLMLAKNERDPAASNLTNAELIRQKLPNAKLVVLSACQTGIENYYAGEGLIGLSRTFLVAGVPLVVASQWRVDSNATAEIMKKFHQYRRRENLTTAAALRRAQLDVAAIERFRQPYFWAAFAVYGGYAEF